MFNLFHDLLNNLVQGRLKIWTYNSFFAIYKQGPLLILQYLINGLGYRCASQFWWKFGTLVVIRHWFQVSRMIGLQLRQFSKKVFAWQFCRWNEVWKNAKNYHISLSHSIQTTWPKLDYEVPVERQYPYL